jgi:hypothetical protein
MTPLPPNNASINQEFHAEERAARPTGVSYTEAPAPHTRMHRETVHAATVYRYTVRGPNTGVRYTDWTRKYPKSGRIEAANCTKLSSKKDQQQMTFFGEGGRTR